MAQSRRPARRHSKPRRSEAQEIAARYVEARNALVRAGRTLHDHIGSSLSAAGVQLQLLRMDAPSVQARVDETIRTLDEALDRIRALSRDLCSSPADRGGLKQALARLLQDISAGREVDLAYSTTAVPPPEIAVALYEAAQSVVEEALREGATRVSITVRGVRPVILRITDNGRATSRARALSMVRTMVCEQGLAFECSTGKSTIVSIAYAVRRPARG